MSDVNSIPLSQVKPLDMSGAKAVHISEMPEESYRDFVKTMEGLLEQRYAKRPETASNPAYKPYAEIRVDGEKVAEIDNHGWVRSSNRVGALFRDRLPDIDQTSGESGPRLAQLRAEFLADLLGGEVRKLPTALTQAQFRAAPEPTITIDREAMKSDPLFQQLRKTEEARALFLARQLGETGE